MKILTLTSILISLISIAYSQTIDQVTVSPSYSSYTYYDLETGETISIDADSWDLSFSTFGFQDAAISINEGSASMGVELELYLLGDMDFDANVTENDLTERVYNQERSWHNGAFNSSLDSSNISDFGWGIYDFPSMTVVGNKLFVLKLRNGELKKIKIESLAGTIYNMTYANLDGTQKKSISIDKKDYEGKQRAYFSFNTESALDLEPENWDLQFTRYSTPIDDGAGNILNYVVTGILSSEGVEVAQADGIDPASVNEFDYSDLYESASDAIGYDWKEIDISNFQWSVVSDRVYFVKTISGTIYKLHFLDFEGASTGITTIEKTEIGTTSNNNEILDYEISLFPNPNNGTFNIELGAPINSNYAVNVYSIDGTLLMNKRFNASDYSEIIELDLKLNSGSYFLKLESKDKFIVERFIVR